MALRHHIYEAASSVDIGQSIKNKSRSSMTEILIRYYILIRDLSLLLAETIVHNHLLRYCDENSSIILGGDQLCRIPFILSIRFVFFAISFLGSSDHIINPCPIICLLIRSTITLINTYI